MKKIFYLIFALISVITFASCQKDTIKITSVTTTSNLTFYEGEINLNKIVLIITKSNGKTEQRSLTNDMIMSDLTQLVIGTNTITIKVEDFTCYLEIILEEKIINNEDYTYLLNDDNASYSITGYHGSEEHLVIPQYYNNLPVTNLSDEAFFQNSIIKSVIIADTVTTIGNACFYNCENLSSVYVPKSVTAIQNYALVGPKVIFIENEGINASWPSKWYDERISSLYFDVLDTTITYDDNYQYLTTDTVTITNCYSSDEIIIVPGTYQNKTITTIGAHAFAFNETLTSVTLPNTITMIDAFAFANCSNLSTITLSNQLKIIQNSAFCYCNSLDNLILPETLEEIGGHVFNSCNSLSTITIPRSVKTIGLYAFAWCVKMTSAYIPNNLLNVNEGVFYSCSKLTIYCELSSKPDTWHSNWNSSNRPIVWNSPIS